MAATLVGETKWSRKTDAEGYRTYTLVNMVVCDDTDDGPQVAGECPGLPLPGAAWVYGNDFDLDVWCRPDQIVDPVVTEEPNYHFIVTNTFSNKPLPQNQQRCNENPTGNPILEPQKVSGSFVKYTEEATVDRFGNPIETSAHEPLRGPEVEFDKNRPTISIEQNVLFLELATVTAMIDTLNDAALWGLPARCVKLSNFSWERKYYGTCYVYYTRKFEFDINFETFDRITLDRGNLVKRGKWDKAPGSLTYKQYVVDPAVGSTGATFPSDYVQFKDWNDENAVCVLDGNGRPWDRDASTTGTGDDTVGTITIQKYDESNFLLLGIPTDF